MKDDLNKDVKTATAAWQSLQEQISSIVSKADVVFNQFRQRTGAWPSPIPGIFKTIEANLEALRQEILKVPPTQVANAFQKLKNGIDHDFDVLISAVTAAGQNARAALDKADTSASQFLNKRIVSFLAIIDGLRVQVSNDVQVLRQAMASQVTAACNDLRTKVNDEAQTVRNAILGKPAQAGNPAQPGMIESLCDLLGSEIDSITGAIRTLLGSNDIISGVKSWLDNFDYKPISELTSYLKRIGNDLDVFNQRLQSGITRYAKSIGQDFFQKADSVLRLMRAFGDSPIVQGMDFNRPQLGYYFDAAKQALDMTPVAAMAKRVAAGAVKELQSLRSRLPTKQLLDCCVPDSLQKLDLSTVLPSFGGMELEKLFSGLKLPDVANQNVKLTHGLDREAMRAWLKADVQIPIAGQNTLFSFGPVLVRLNTATLEGHVTVAASVNGGTERTESGAITGDWEVTFGGMQIVTFLTTTLKYENKRLNFSIVPSHVKLSGVLNFLSQIISSLGSSDSGFSLAMLVENNIPAGIRAQLNLPFPDIVSGTTGISNLILTAGFELRVLSPDGKFDFSLAVSFGLGRKTAPFTITMFILGGTGYIELGARYTPSTGSISCSVSLAIGLSASLEIALGPIRGGVYVGLAITADFQAGSGSGVSLAVGAMLLIRGEVDLLGIVSATIILQLEVQYVTAPGRHSLVARGMFSITVKICWCFTLSISTSVEYHVGDVGDSSNGGGAVLGPRPPFMPGGFALGAFTDILADGSAPPATEPTLNDYEAVAYQYLGRFE